MIYKKETFTQLIKKSDCFNETIYTKNLRRYKFLEELYNKNYINNISTKQNIPKIIHHIWLGSDIPEKYNQYIETWKKYNPEYTFYLWTDEEVKKINLKNIDLYNKTNNLGQKSDILRYELLYEFGGIYIDSDFECLKSLDDLLYLKLFTSIAYPTTIEFYIGLIASEPKNSIIETCINNMKEISDITPINIMLTTGNYYFTRCFLNNKNFDGVVAFPFDFFYPFPNTNRKTILGDERKKFIKDFSYAIHHWGVSWV